MDPGLDIVVDLVREVTDIGELTKLGTVLGFEVVVERTPPEDRPEEMGHYWRVRMYRPERDFGEVSLASLAIIQAVARDRSGNDILDRLRSDLEKWHMPMDRPLGDVMSIGGGPDHEDH